MSFDRPWLPTVGVGLVCGLASGLLGIGGAVIMVPLLVAVLGLTQHRAHGTSLVVTIFTASAALIGYARGGYLDLGLALTLAAGSVIGSPLGARWAQATSAATLRRAFGVLIALVGIRLFLVQLPEGQLIPTDGVPGILAHVLLGFAVGVLSGFFGVGGGVVLIPALVLLSGVPQHLAQGVSLLFIIPTVLVGGWTHYRLGNVDTRIVLPLAAASSAAAVLASLVAATLPATTLRILFGCLLVVVGLRLALVPRRGRSESDEQNASSR
jgi:uncharacterized membrane protein YfcA